MRMARELQRAYLALVDAAARRTRSDRGDIVRSLAARAKVLNPEARITGDAIDHAAGQLLRRRPALSPESIHRLVQAYADDQDQDPDRVASRERGRSPRLSSIESRLLERMRAITRELREGL
jgi:hypothetical protein